MQTITDTVNIFNSLDTMPGLRNVAEVAFTLEGPPPPMDPKLLEFLLYAALTGLSAATIKKGVDFVNYVFGLVVMTSAYMHGGTQPITQPEMPGYAKSLLTLAITLVLPPAAYAVFIIDTGLATFDWVKLTAAVGVGFAGAWAWYQREKNTKRNST